MENDSIFLQELERLKSKSLSPLHISRIIETGLPFCFSIRKSPTSTLLHCTYFKTPLNSLFIHSKIPVLLGRLEWPDSVIKALPMVIEPLSRPKSEGCLGLEGSGNVLKIDFAGTSLARILIFLRKVKTSESAIHHLVQTSRNLEEIQPNYFAVKYAKSGLFGWKVYFVKKDPYFISNYE